ncbi:PREDICTED: uncharacterized protein LOC105312798 [Amphimedon queenslandica]|uniref:REJ domain-containing protein n=1 Tax=Amphimedon queenslandica TaxID=400682 RepID=A0AAN0J574_AMPQE|nr:PREDICTED: uncharacterized protein LOC105312798 [Amphimedon queenslandica]|eukprot:XP_019852169.1 PREDICTED: uncharacterized protein LOC105312798 [Amphimedon queenslandica]
MDDCRGDSLYLPQSVCSRHCNQSLCSIGCSSAYATVNGQGEEVQRPHSPPPNSVFSLEKFSSPYLHLPGTYSLSFNMGEGLLGNASTDVSVTSYILEGAADGINAYYWIMSLDDTLSIDYSQLCKNLSIRFIPVNRHGPSNSFSQPTTLEVYGGKTCTVHITSMNCGCISVTTMLTNCLCNNQLHYITDYDLISPITNGRFVVEVRATGSQYVTRPSLQYFDARGLPPTVPRNVKVSKLTIKSNGKLNIIMDWFKAEELYGTDGYYKVHIGLSERVGPDDTATNDTVFLLDASTVSQRSSTTVSTS